MRTGPPGTSPPSAAHHERQAGLSWPRGAGQASPASVTLRDLIPSMHYDARTVSDATGALERFAGLPCDVLLQGGTNSSRQLTATLDGLTVVLPHARRVTLHRAGHTAADNGGNQIALPPSSATSSAEALHQPARAQASRVRERRRPTMPHAA